MHTMPARQDSGPGQEPGGASAEAITEGRHDARDGTRKVAHSTSADLEAQNKMAPTNGAISLLCQALRSTGRDEASLSIHGQRKRFRKATSVINATGSRGAAAPRTPAAGPRRAIVEYPQSASTSARKIENLRGSSTPLRRPHRVGDASQIAAPAQPGQLGNRCRAFRRQAVAAADDPDDVTSAAPGSPSTRPPTGALAPSHAASALDDRACAPTSSGMGGSQTEASPSPARRQALRVLSVIACAAFAISLAGCAQGSAESWERPDWMRSKRGSNGNGAGRR